MKKKLLAAILALVLALSLLPATALAEGESISQNPYSFSAAQPVNSEVAATLNTLAAVGIMNGYPNGSLGLENNVTRAEMAKMVAVVTGAQAEAVAGATADFTDTQGHWADGYINYCADQGIVAGCGNGAFVPDAAVTGTEAATMLLRALGYTDETVNGGAGFVYSGENYAAKAQELEVIQESSTSNIGDMVKRDRAAQMIYAALSQKMMTTNESGEAVPVLDSDGEPVSLISKTAGIKRGFYVSMAELSAGHTADLEPYLYETMDVYMKGDKIVYVDDSDSVVLHGTLGEVWESGLSLVSPADGGRYVLSSKNIPVCLNGVEVDWDVVCQGQYAGASLKLVLDADKKITGIVLEKFDKAKVVSEAYKSGKTIFAGYSLPVDTNRKADFDRIKVMGDVARLEDIKRGDVIEVAQNGRDGSMKLLVTRNTVAGTVTKISGEKYYIDGTAYSLGESYSDLSGVVLGADGTFRLNSAGKIVDCVLSEKPLEWHCGIITADILAAAQFKIVGTDGKLRVLTAEMGAEDSGFVSKNGVWSYADAYAAVTGTEYKIARYRLNNEGKIAEVSPANVGTVPLASGVTADSDAFLADENTAILNCDADGVLTEISLSEVKRDTALEYQYVGGANGWELLILRDGAAEIQRRCGLLAEMDTVAADSLRVTLVTAGVEQSYETTAQPENVKVGDIVSYTIADGALTALDPFDGETIRRATLKSVEETYLVRGGSSAALSFAEDLSIFSNVTTSGAYKVRDMAALRSAEADSSGYTSVDIYTLDGAVQAVVIGQTYYYSNSDPSPVISTLYGLYTGMGEDGKAKILTATETKNTSTTLQEEDFSDIQFAFAKFTLTDGVITGVDMLSDRVYGSFVSLEENILKITPYDDEDASEFLLTATTPTFLVTGTGESRTAEIASTAATITAGEVAVYRENGTVGAVVIERAYTITASAGEHGTISPSGTVTVNYDGSHTFDFSANYGYHIKDVTVDGTSVGADSSFTFENVTADHTIHVTFEPNPVVKIPSTIHNWIQVDAITGSAVLEDSLYAAVQRSVLSTRATADGMWDNGNAVAVCLRNEVKRYAAKSIGSTTMLEPADAENTFYWQSTEVIPVSAWYPIQNSGNSLALPSMWTVQQNQNDNNGYQNSDFLYAPQQDIDFNGTNLTFYHQVAKVVVNIRNDGVPAGAEPSVRINAAPQGTFTVPQPLSNYGLLAVQIPPQEITPLKLDSPNTNVVFGDRQDGEIALASYQALVIPQDPVSFDIEIKIDEATYKYTLPQSEWEGGNEYTYNLTIE